jgi:AraC-like DNA-binding protein
MQIDYSELLSLMGACQGFILAIFLFLNKKIQLAGKILAVFTMVFSIGLLESLIAPLSNNSFFFWLPDFVGGSSFLYGPLLYFYIPKSLKPNQNINYHKHLLIFYVFTAGLIFYELLKDVIDLNFNEKEIIIIEIIAYELLFVQLFIYCYLCIKTIKPYKKQQQTSFVIWLWLLSISLTIIYLLSFISTNLFLLGFNFENILISIVQLASVILVYSFSYHALFQKNNTSPVTPKYNSSPIIEVNKDAYLQKICHSMEKDMLFLDPTLTLDKLSDILGINRFYISQVINEKLGKNFSDFVNAYRVEKTKALLFSEKGHQYTLLAIAFESGFNSKTSFNAVFKKHTGLTPSAYKKANLLKMAEKL